MSRMLACSAKLTIRGDHPVYAPASPKQHFFI
jgi:hypothetical protein